MIPNTREKKCYMCNHVVAPGAGFINPRFSHKPTICRACRIKYLTRGESQLYSKRHAFTLYDEALQPAES